MKDPKEQVFGRLLGEAPDLLLRALTNARCVKYRKKEEHRLTLHFCITLKFSNA